MSLVRIQHLRPIGMYMQKYKLTFKHWKTEEVIEKEVIELGFPVEGYRDVFYSVTDDTYIDVLRDTIISLEPIKDSDTEQ